LEKNKNNGYILFITTLQPLRLAFFNSITKILNFCILNHFLLLSTYYFFPICCTIPNDLNFFLACSHLALKNESKEAPPFWTFFHTNVSLWSATAHFFTRPKKRFLWIWKLISCNLRSEKLWNLFHMFSSQNTTRSYS